MDGDINVYLKNGIATLPEAMNDAQYSRVAVKAGVPLTPSPRTLTPILGVLNRRRTYLVNCFNRGQHRVLLSATSNTV